MDTQQIRQTLKGLIADLQGALDQEPVRKINEFTLTLGATPRYGERFGVERKKKQLVFGDWIDQLEASFQVAHHWDMLLTREAFWFFLDDQYFENGLAFLSNMFLNFLACAHISNGDTSATPSYVVGTVKSRFIPLEEKVSQKDNDLLHDVLTLLDSVLLQNISPKMLLSTYDHFVDDFSQSDYEVEDIVQDITRYLTHTSEQIAAPVLLKPNVLATIKELIAGGFKTSAPEIGEKLGKEQSTISRQLVKLSKTYSASWRKRMNWSKLGLHQHVFYVTLPLDQEEEFERVCEDLLKLRYVEAIYAGRGEDNLVIYSNMSCPYLVADNLERKLERMEFSKRISSFRLLPVKVIENYMGFVKEAFAPKLTNYELLLAGKIHVEKLQIYNTEWFEDKEVHSFELNEGIFLEFLAVLISNSLSATSNYGVWMPELMKLLQSKGMEITEHERILGYLNKLQNQTLDMNLFLYSLRISLHLRSAHSLHLRLKGSYDEEAIKDIVDKFTVFGYTFVLKSYEETIVIISGPDFDSEFTAFLLDQVRKHDVEFEYCILKCKTWRHVPLHELYDYLSKKWLLK